MTTKVKRRRTGKFHISTEGMIVQKDVPLPVVTRMEKKKEPEAVTFTDLIFNMQVGESVFTKIKNNPENKNKVDKRIATIKARKDIKDPYYPVRASTVEGEEGFLRIWRES